MRKTVAILLLIVGIFTYPKLQAQEKHTFHGVVIDMSNKQPKEGVSILFEGKRPIAFTNSDGKFTLSLADSSTVSFTMVGYEEAKVKLIDTGKGVIVVQLLAKSNSSLKDITVMGFKSVSRQLNTGASVIITSKDIEDNPGASVEGLLQGRVAGLNIQNNNGAPGAQSSIMLRGLSNINVVGSGAGATLTPTSPLFVVDGVPIDLNSQYSYGAFTSGPGISPLSSIPVEDIDQIVVLKDAAATALWGSRGAYGVILITTKRGKSEVPVVSYYGQYTYSAVPKLRSVIGGNGERNSRIAEILGYDTSYRNALSLINSTAALSDSLNPYYNNSTNWQSVFYRPTSSYQHDVNISGGSNKLNYKTDVGVLKQIGIIKNTGITRYSLDMNALYQPTDKFRLMVSVNSAVVTNQKGSGIGLLQQGVGEAGTASSLLPPPSSYSSNSAALSGLFAENSNKTISVQPSIDLQFEPVSGLRFDINANYNYNSAVSYNVIPSSVSSDGYGQYGQLNQHTYSIDNRNQITYTKSLGKDSSGNATHSFSFLIFNEVTSSEYRTNQSSIHGIAGDNLQGPNGYNWSQTTAGTLNDINTSRTVNFGGDFSYNYKLRYVFDFQYLAEGTSTNGPNTGGYQKSPTFSARWNMQNEKFFKNLADKWMNESSLRFSYGTIIYPTGNIFTTYGEFDPSSNYNGQQTITSNYNYLPNQNYKSYTNTTLDIGYEGQFLNNKVSVMYDYYYSMKDNEPYVQALPNTSGFSSITTNAISLVSYGHELTLTYLPFQKARGDKFSWTISANAAYNKDILAKLPNGQRQIITYVNMGFGTYPVLYRLGSNPITTLVYNTAGVFSTNSSVPVDPVTGRPVKAGAGSNVYYQAGDPRFTDLNGDYIIDQNDLMALGNPEPKITGGIQSFTQYKQWSLQFNVSFTLFRDVLNSALAQRLADFASPASVGSSGSAIVPISQYNYWNQPGDAAKYPNPYNFIYSSNIQPFRYNQSLFYEDGSYWKFNQITVAYTPDRKWSEKFGVSSAKLYLTMSNVFTITKYSGPNPENVNSFGIDDPNGYPNAKQYTVGLQLQF